MKSAPPRPNEPAALAALHRLDVLDSAPEPEFDALVRAASIVCGTPISLLSLVDAERQWFKANIGLPEVAQTPRELAFCAHAVLDEALFEVPDARDDPRFRDNPLVADDPNIRFYAAVPLRLSGGELVGTLCVIDRQPRQLDAAQREVLQCLAIAAAKALEGRRALRAMAAAQRDNEALLGVLHQHAIVSVADRRGRITDVNDAFCSLSGYDRDALLGQDHRLLNSGLHGHSFWREMWRTIGSGRAWRGEVCNRARDGSLYWVNSIVAPVPGADGQVEKYISIRHDISDHVLARQALERSNERFSIAAGAARLGFWDFDIASGSASWDAQMHRLYGRSPTAGPAPYALWTDSLHPEDRPTAERALAEAINGVRPFDTGFRIVLPNGAVRHLRAVARLMLDQDGIPQRMFGVNFDITEQAEAELALQRRESLMRLVSDSFPGPLAHWDAQMRCTFANQAYQGWLGLRPLEMVGRTQRELFGEATFAQNRQAMLAALKGEPQSLERTRDCADGQQRHYLLHYVPELDGDEVRGFISVVVDVTLMKTAERQLRHAVHTAETANRAKSQFLANMSHEIRTPMNAVIGLAYLMERTPLNAEQIDTLGKIKLASKSLLSIINDVLDLSKIEAAEMQIESVPFMLGDVLAELTSLARLQANAKGVGFILHAPDLPVAIEGDATRLRQVLTNLISNAIKFTERGGVQLQVEQLDAVQGRVRLRFAVKDTGIGIAEAALGRLFTPFVQADVSTTRRFGGTGLGLSIVKQLVALMGGELGVASTPGQGSEFWVALDFARGDLRAATALLDAALPATTGPRLQGVRVLVADDSAINLEVARRILELEGALVWLANNGQEAVEYLLAAPGAVDVVLMDVQMPVLDGHDATRRIRSGLGFTQLPVIALTAGISTGEHARAAAAGMNDMLAKPFDPAALVRCIRKHVKTEGQVPTATAIKAAGPDAWPDIEGIDTLDVQQRLGGDVVLFRSLLERLLDEFGDLLAERGASDSAQLAARLHNLKGSAGTLGARALARRAARAEQACRAGQVDRLPIFLQQTASALAGLQRSVAALPRPAEAVEAITGELDTAALRTLLEHLRGFDLAAVAGFRALAPHLRSLLGQDAFAALRRQIDSLRFAEAATTLAEVAHGAGREQSACHQP